MFLIKKTFDYLAWALFFGFLLLSGVVYVSDRTYPGNSLYPVKLKFEGFVLATSKILNKQVDFSIDLVSQRSNEVAKILTPSNSEETLSRLDVQVELTASSISQIPDPVEKKKAAKKYIAKLTEVSMVLNEKQKGFVTEEAQPEQTTQEQITAVQPSVTAKITQQTVTQQPVTPIVAMEEPSRPAEAPQNIVPTDTPVNPPAPETTAISQQIGTAQQTVQQAIDDMNNISEDPQDQKKDNNKDKEEKKKNDNDIQNNESTI